MIVSIHQPQYMPWLPYLKKIEDSDMFIFLDTVDFQKNGLQNRNQVKTSEGAHWLTVPVRQRLGQKIIDVNIDSSTDWRRKHLQTLKQCYKKSSAFKMYEEDLERLLGVDWQSLCDLNIEATTTMLRWMGIHTPVRRSSQMAACGTASSLVLNLCVEAGATTYLSGVGGKSYLNEDEFREAGVDIFYQPAVLPNAYPQLFPKAGFFNNLSALDLMLNCGDSWRGFVSDGGLKS